MKPARPHVVLALGAALLCGPLPAQQQGASAPSRRSEIAAERSAIDRRHVEDEAACRTRFVVTSCLNDARDRRRAELAPLRQEELRIDTQERKQRAATRLGDIEAKQRAEAAREAASATPVEREAAGPREPPRPASRIAGEASKKPMLSGEERARREAESEARFERQQREAASHRAAVEARNADRAAKGKVVKPLPVAPGASAL